MAYSYFPATYQPATYQQYQPYQQAFYQPAQQPVQQQATTTSIIWVSGDREAQMYPVAPNNAVTLWSQAEPVVYLKQADATGKPTLKTYDLVERATSASNATSATDDKRPAYATKDDLSAIVGAIKGHSDDLASVRADIESLKSDMYGIAGKKKTVKKPEADDE